MINTTVIQGNITADVELRSTQNGTTYTRFNVAVNERENSYFFPVVAWRATAEFIQKYFRKGSQIAIEGRLTQRTYTDSNGIKHNIIEIVANSAHFCGNKASNSPANPQQAAAATNNGAGNSAADLSEFEEILSDGDVPF